MGGARCDAGAGAVDEKHSVHCRAAGGCGDLVSLSWSACVTQVDVAHPDVASWSLARRSAWVRSGGFATLPFTAGRISSSRSATQPSSWGSPRRLSGSRNTAGAISCNILLLSRSRVFGGSSAGWVCRCRHATTWHWARSRWLRWWAASGISVSNTKYQIPRGLLALPV